MALVLSVDEAAWLDHVSELATRLEGRLTPVVKANGYGLGRGVLRAHLAALGLGEVAIGTVYELADAGASAATNLVLTPTFEAHLADLPAWAVPTVDDPDQLRALEDGAGETSGRRVAVKLRSSMRRYGVTPDGLGPLLDRLAVAPHVYVLHLPLAGTDDDRLAEIEDWLPHLDAATPLSVSHLTVESFEALEARHPGRSFRFRTGTHLWLGDKSNFTLSADVTAVHAVDAGQTAGYRLGTVPADGTIVVIGAGSAHGVQALVDGRSPFHFERRRLALLEPPHLHSSMAFVPAGEPCPAVGDAVDVQRPLTQTLVDRIVWVR